MLSPHVRDSLVELKAWTLVEAAIMHEFLDQIETAEATRATLGQP